MEKITLIIGSMFSGKTTECLRLLDNKRIAKKKCLIIKYSRDTRYDDEFITTHSQYQYNKTNIKHFETITTDDVDNIIDDGYQVVFIDEGQFFKDIHLMCDDLANNGVEVLVSALDGDYKQEPFGDIPKLIAISEKVIKLSGVCMFCNDKKGSFTVRTIKSDEHELIGGEEMYKSACRKCMNLYKKNKINQSNQILSLN